MSVFIGDTQDTYLSLLTKDLVGLLDDYVSATVLIEAKYLLITTRVRVLVGVYASPWIYGTSRGWKSFLHGDVMETREFSLVLFGKSAQIVCPDFSLTVSDVRLRQKFKALLWTPRLTRYLVWFLLVYSIYRTLR